MIKQGNYKYGMIGNIKTTLKNGKFYVKCGSGKTYMTFLEMDKNALDYYRTLEKTEQTGLIALSQAKSGNWYIAYHKDPMTISQNIIDQVHNEL